jgi:hypothetical protein
MVCGKYEYFMGSMSREAIEQRDKEQDDKIKLKCSDIITKINVELSQSNFRTRKTKFFETIQDMLNRSSNDYDLYKTIRYFVLFNNRNKTKLSIRIGKLINLND